MTDPNPKYPNFYDDMVDIRQLFTSILSHKWVIISITLLVTLAAFLINSLLLRTEYEAAAYIALTEPIMRIDLDPSIQISPVTPDMGALSELAEADAIIDMVINSLALENYLEDYTLEMEATLQGKSQLRLLVTTEDSIKAAQIANGWAQVVIDRLNDLYGTGDQVLPLLENEVQQAKENWKVAQENLEAYLPNSRVEALKVQLNTAKHTLETYLLKIDSNQLLISDAETVKIQLETLKMDTSLSPGMVLSIITVQQQTSGAMEESPIQLQVDQSITENYSAEEGMEVVNNLISAVMYQNIELEKEITALENRITLLAVTLEFEMYKVEQFTLERDLAKNTYTALANQLKETRITQAYEVDPAKFGAEAMVPKKTSGPNKMLNTGLAAFIGGMIAVCSVLMYAWWTSEEKLI